MSEGGEAVAVGGDESLSGVTHQQPVAEAQAVDTNNPNSIPTSNENVRTESSGLETPRSWEWSDGVSGDGNRPDWFHEGTFKNIAAQAEGYSKLHSEYSKRMGGFIGAPEGDYKINLSQDLTDHGVEFSQEDPMYKKFSEAAKGLNMNQDTYDSLINIYADAMHTNNSKFNEGMVADYNEMISQEESALGRDDSESFNYAIERATMLPGVSQKGLDGLLNGICTADDARAFTALVNNGNYSPAPEGAYSGPVENHHSLQERLGALKGRAGPDRDRVIEGYKKLFPGEKRFGA